MASAGGCVAEFGACSGGERCCSPLGCYQQSRWYSQCGTACPRNANPPWDCAAQENRVGHTQVDEEDSALLESAAAGTAAVREATTSRIASCKQFNGFGSFLSVYTRLPRVGNQLMCVLLGACTSSQMRSACGIDSSTGGGCLSSPSSTTTHYGNFKLVPAVYGMCAGPNGTSAQCSSAAGDQDAVCKGLRNLRLPGSVGCSHHQGQRQR